MAVLNRRDNKAYDPEEIRHLVESEDNPALRLEQPEQTDYNPRHSYREELESAPLFVKVEKYKDIVDSVHELKRFVSGIKQLFLIMNELHGIQQNSISILRASIQRLEKSIEWIDHSLIKPAGFEELPHGQTEMRQIEQSLSELQREIANIKRDLEKLV